MTNYEKLISSVLLSTVLTGKAFGWGCNCDDNDDNDENEILDLADHIDINTCMANTDNSVPNDTTPTNNDLQATSDDSEKIINGDFSQLFNFYETNLDNNNPKELSEELNKKNQAICNKIIAKINEQCNNFFENYEKKIKKIDIANYSFVEQIQLIGLMIDVSKCFLSKKVSLDTFSKNLLYSFRKKQFNKFVKNKFVKNTNVEKGLTIKDNSPIKTTYLKVRNVIFEALYKYFYKYLETGLEKFGLPFYNKDMKESIPFNYKISIVCAYDNNQSDKNDYLSNVIGEKNICRNTFEDIDYIIKEMSNLPKFNEVFQYESEDTWFNGIKYKKKQNQSINAYYCFYKKIEKQYSQLKFDKSKNHILNFFSCITKGKNDPNSLGEKVERKFLELASMSNIDQNTIFKFKKGIKIDNINFKSNSR